MVVFYRRAAFLVPPIAYTVIETVNNAIEKQNRKEKKKC